MKFSKIREVKSPIRSTPKSAGIDFFIPVFDSQFLLDFKLKNSNIQINNTAIILNPNERCLIPSGIHVNIPDGFMLNAFNKSGISSRRGLIKAAETIDEDYLGEIHISLINSSNEIVVIEQNEKIIQFILIPISYLLPYEVEFSELYIDKESSRGSGGFGSTGIK